MIDFDYEWFKQECRDNGLKIDCIMAVMELDEAKLYSQEMMFWTDQIKKARKKRCMPEKHWLWSEEAKEIAIEGFKRFYKEANNNRIKHMLNALEYAEYSKRNIDPAFEKHLVKIYTATGNEMPII